MPTLGASGMVKMDWQHAEESVARWMRANGWPDATLTPPGADAGVDVVADLAVAQVKAWDRPVPRGEIQRFQGAAAAYPGEMLFFSTSGYSSKAVDWAEQYGVALFVIRPDGRVTTPNGDVVGGAVPPPTPLPGTAPSARMAEQVVATLRDLWRWARRRVAAPRPPDGLATLGVVPVAVDPAAQDGDMPPRFAGVVSQRMQRTVGVETLRAMDELIDQARVLHADTVWASGRGPTVVAVAPKLLVLAHRDLAADHRAGAVSWWRGDCLQHVTARGRPFGVQCIEVVDQLGAAFTLHVRDEDHAARLLAAITT